MKAGVRAAAAVRSGGAPAMKRGLPVWLPAAAAVEAWPRLGTAAVKGGPGGRAAAMPGRSGLGGAVERGAGAGATVPAAVVFGPSVPARAALPAAMLFMPPFVVALVHHHLAALGTAMPAGAFVPPARATAIHPGPPTTISPRNAGGAMATSMMGRS